ncbi:MAG TPA: nodulation protein NfeD [Dehalococcoidia bacterium]|nr:nodulation protein NfeD [Dehalococcoidia bacterium]
MNRRWPLLLRPAALLSLLLLALAPACAGPAAEPGAVHVLTAHGNVGPVMARYIDRGIDHAEDEEASAVVVQLDTPGGLLTSMDDIVKRILAARVPVIVYVWPPGGRAASAGTFIVMASHVAAMAPGTSIGAATPVSIGGEPDETLRDKATNDAAARIRDIALLRGRNADWAEAAVREAASASSEEALRIGVVDLVAASLGELLLQVDGRQVTLQDGRTVTLQTASAPVVHNGISLAERALDVLADPNIALLLLSLGTLALAYEIFNPGAIFPGVFGIIAIILGFFALTVIPFNWAGLALVLVGLALLVLEGFITSHGVLGIGGVVSLVLGALFLTGGNPRFAGPDIEVNRWLVYGLAAALGLFFAFVATNVVRARRQPALMGPETMVGRRAVARSPLTPSGFVLLDGEYWQAEAEDGEVQPGEAVVVTAREGLRLKVRKAPTTQEGGSEA